MPGSLREDAVCPVCGVPLLALVDCSTRGFVDRDYYHVRMAGQLRRREPCIKRFEDHEKAAEERRGLEV